MLQQNWSLIVMLPFFAGVAVSTQAAINGQLREAVQSPLIAAFLSFFIGTVVLAILIFLTKQEVPDLRQLTGVAWYKYLGGFLGAFFVTGIIVSVQRLSVANMIALVVAGQLIVALLYDHFGLIGVKQSSITLTRMAGAAALILGAYLINKK